jgi:hypothetical protein
MIAQDAENFQQVSGGLAGDIASIGNSWPPRWHHGSRLSAEEVQVQFRQDERKLRRV